jgi:hypothetical protein
METDDDIQPFKSLGAIARALVSDMQPAPTVLLEVSPPLTPMIDGMELPYEVTAPDVPRVAWCERPGGAKSPRTSGRRSTA